MTDIVERLNEPCPCSYCDGDAANQRDEAKAEIERLRKALDKAADALHDAGLHDAWAEARAALEGKE